jgi:hypothetical protein
MPKPFRVAPLHHSDVAGGSFDDLGQATALAQRLADRHDLPIDVWQIHCTDRGVRPRRVHTAYPTPSKRTA